MLGTAVPSPNPKPSTKFVVTMLMLLFVTKGETKFGTLHKVWLQMAYILVVNAGILRDTGGPCSVHDCEVGNYLKTSA